MIGRGLFLSYLFQDPLNVCKSISLGVRHFVKIPLPFLLLCIIVED